MKRFGLIVSLLLMVSVFANAEITESEARQYARAYLEEKTDYNLNCITVAQTKNLMTRLEIALGDSEVDLSSYPKGIYLINVVIDNDSYTEKVVLK